MHHERNPLTGNRMNGQPTQKPSSPWHLLLLEKWVLTWTKEKLRCY